MTTTRDPKKYHSYLESPEWKEKRRLVIERENGICQGCNSEHIEEVHHLTYTHLYDELLFHLVGLCENCHRKSHFIDFSFDPWKP
jgi:5-methylcytosine-specific restriction endonuclease McrA